MSTRIMTLLLSGAIGFTAIGCATSPVMRAQNAPAQQVPVEPAGWQQPYMAGSCQSCQISGGAHFGHDPNQLINLPFHPIHRNSYTYNVPRGMMYPPAPSQAGIYQYPYYTLRGPTDFFMK